MNAPSEHPLAITPSELTPINSVEQVDYMSYPLLVNQQTLPVEPVKARVLSHNRQYMIVAIASIATLLLTTIVAVLFFAPLIAGLVALIKKIDCNELDHRIFYTNTTSVKWNEVSKLSVLLDNGKVTFSKRKDELEQVQLVVNKKAAKKKYLYAVEENFLFRDGELIISNKFIEKCKLNCYFSSYEVVLPQNTKNLDLFIQSTSSISLTVP